VVSVYSFYTQTPSKESIQAIEDTDVYSVSYAELENIYDVFPEFNYNGRKLTIKYLIEYSKQMELIRAMSGREKYEALIEKHPGLVTRVPQKYLASYVDMLPETFSKIKGEYKS
jgi:CRP-like cAMP-binding protein